MDTHFDVLVLGTGLTQSITAAALAKAGFKVIHFDQNSYYGADQASLSHEELLEWSRSTQLSNFSGFSSSSQDPLPFSRSYSLSIAPALIPAVGPLVTALILSGVSRYGQFQLLDAVYIHRRGTLERVPGNKEDIFKAREVSLIDKRKLMRFLQFASGDFEGKSELEGQQFVPLGDFMRDRFSLDKDACDAILYALAYCTASSDPTLPALRRLRKYLKSAGRYGNSPFLIGHYGGLGELAQGFCRTCAVNGGAYILGRKILSLQLPSETPSARAVRASIELEDIPGILTADLVITSEDYLPISSPPQLDHGVAYACGIAIVDLTEITKPVKSSQTNTVVVIFPPGSLLNGKASNVVHILQVGENTLSCPQGKSILYLWTRADASINNSEELLRPYLSALMSEDGRETGRIDFTLFYLRHDNPANTHPRHPRTLVVPSLSSAWPENADQSAQDAECLFWNAVQELGDEEDKSINAFWPPLDTLDEDEGSDW